MAKTNAEEKLCYTVPEMAEALGICRQRAYELTRIEGFPAIRLGTRIVIPKDKLVQWLNEKAGETILA